MMSLVLATAATSWGQTQGDLVTANGMAGLRFYQVDHWGLVSATIANPTDQPVSPLLAVNFTPTPHIQFANRVWVPPHSRRQFLTPVYPTHPGSNDRAMETQTRLIDDTGPRELAATASPGLLIKHHVRFATGVMADRDDKWPRAALSAMRLNLRMKPTTSQLSPANAPEYGPAWSALDGLLISRHHVGLNIAQRDALRQWLLEGGRLWIMIDQVDPNFPAALLGEDWDLAIIDRVGLTDFVIEGGKKDQPVHLDYPIDMLRVVAPSMQVLQTVRDYPVAMRKQIGKGQLLVTTLFARGYLDDVGAGNMALQKLHWFASTAALSENHNDISAFDSLVGEQIGYTVMSRKPVLVVLVVLAGALLFTGMWLSRGGRLEYLGPIGAVMALLGAAVLIGAGLARQGKVASTAASAQLVEFAANEPFASITAQVGIYNPPIVDGQRPVLRGNQGGRVWPRLTAQSGDLLRMIWTDANQWHFKNLSMPAGAVLTADLQQMLVLADPPKATISFDSDGIQGQWHGGQAIVELVDPLIATATRWLYPRFDDSKTRFAATAADILPPDQFMTSGMLTQSQMARQAVYRRLLPRHGYPNVPTLFGWTKAMPLGLDYAHIDQQRGWALVSIPLHINTPTPGTRITIPSAFMTMQPLRIPKRITQTTLYNPQTGQWISQASYAMQLLMRFDAPSELGHIAIESATLTVDLKAPGRPYDVIVFRDDQVQTVRSGRSPLGLMSFTLKGDDVPLMLANGGVGIGVNVGNLPGQAAGRSWTIKKMELSITGKAQDRR